MTTLTTRRGRAILGLGIITAFAALRIYTSNTTPIPSSTLRDAASLSTAILIESFPFIILGILLSIIVRVWTPTSLITRLTPQNPIARRIVMSFIGTLLPVCECGNVPLARALLRQGLSAGDVIAFTLSAPLLNPVTIMTTYQAFGSDNGILWGRLIGGFIIAQLTAWAITRKHTHNNLLTPALTQENNDNTCTTGHCTPTTHDHEHHNRAARITESLRIFQTETAILLPPLIFGALIAGLIQVGISRNILLTVGADPILSVLAMIALAFIVSICSSVDAFFALSLAAAFTPGALIAFLIFGAMVDIKMLMLLRTTYTTSTLLRLVLIATLFTATLGMGVNYSGISA